MKRHFKLRTVRGRLLLAAICVETLMLSLMVGNGLRILDSSLTQQARLHADQLTPVLRAALVTPLAQRDYATLQAILDESHRAEVLDYMAVSDSRGRVVASKGLAAGSVLPEPAGELSLRAKDGQFRYDVRSQIAIGTQELGSLQFGLDLTQIVSARRQQLLQSLAIATGEILLSAGMLAAIGIWLTRHLSQLTEVSEEVARGNYTPGAVAEGDDDIGRLGAAFNAMSRAVRTDIAKLKEHQLELDQLRRRYELILNSAGEGIIGLDRACRVVFANRAASAILGLHTDQLIGTDISVLLADPGKSLCDSQSVSLEDCCRDGIVGRLRGQMVRRGSGGLIPVDLFATPITGDGTIEGAVLVLRDATLRLQYDATLADQQRELEQQVARRTAELRISQERLKGITDSLVEGVIVVDHRGILLFANPSAARLLEAGEGTAIEGRHIDSIIQLGKGSARLPFQASPWREAMTLGSIVQENDAVFVLASGKAIPVAFACAGRLADPEGDEAIISFRDIGALQKAEQDAMQSARLATVGQLAAGIAHEINTPVQYIGDNLRYMDRSVAKLIELIKAAGVLAADAAALPGLSGSVAHYQKELAAAKPERLMRELPKAVGESLDGVAQIARIVMSMKEFSHPGSSGKTATDINRAIENTLTVSRNVWKHVAAVECAFDPHLPPVPCHAGEMNQVLLNLVVNAAQAIESSGKQMPGVISIATRVVGDQVEIKVSDSGSGVPAAIRERIFDPFFTTKVVGKGTGQGLAICRDVIVTKHGGSISVGGDDGVGAVFTVHLPLDGALITSEA